MVCTYFLQQRFHRHTARSHSVGHTGTRSNKQTKKMSHDLPIETKERLHTQTHNHTINVRHTSTHAKKGLIRVTFKTKRRKRERRSKVKNNEKKSPCERKRGNKVDEKITHDTHTHTRTTHTHSFRILPLSIQNHSSQSFVADSFLCHFGIRTNRISWCREDP